MFVSTHTHTHTHMNTLSKRTFAAKVQVQHRWRKSICPDIRRIHIHQSSGYNTIKRIISLSFSFPFDVIMCIWLLFLHYCWFSYWPIWWRVDKNAMIDYYRELCIVCLLISTAYRTFVLSIVLLRFFLSESRTFRRFEWTMNETIM